MTSTQMRMARAALDWSVRTVAERAQVQRIAVMQLERGKTGHPLTIRAIAKAFEAAGIEFLSEDAPGVRLRTEGISRAV
jgi:transcriptional regulator with XRE-family HTH domain